METSFYTFLYRFIVGGTILAGSTWLANNSNPLLAGILITIPLELVSLFFVKKHNLAAYAESILIMSIATVVPVLYYNLIYPYNFFTYPFDVISSFLVWIIVGVTLFFLYNENIKK
jgi:hypothetical protein